MLSSGDLVGDTAMECNFDDRACGDGDMVAPLAPLRQQFVIHRALLVLPEAIRERMAKAKRRG